MKIRIGFVSNSSTTSFCVVGYPLSFNENDMENIANKLFPNGGTPCFENEFDFVDFIEESLNKEYEKQEITFEMLRENLPCHADAILGVSLGGYSDMKQFDLSEINNAFEIVQERLSKALDEKEPPDMFISIVEG